MNQLHPRATVRHQLSSNGEAHLHRLEDEFILSRKEMVNVKSGLNKAQVPQPVSQASAAPPPPPKKLLDPQAV